MLAGEFDRPGDHGPISRTLVAASSRGSFWFESWESECRVAPDVAPPPPPAFSISTTHVAVPMSIEPSPWGHRCDARAGFARGAESYRGTGGSSELEYAALPHW